MVISQILSTVNYRILYPYSQRFELKNYIELTARERPGFRPVKMKNKTETAKQ